ncbi:hypothetical protein F4823DRAFT_623740 [Ustulina deusta]|nr:hypothetical protein F4823DRAFT_623740 [Ustulina deusta]
MEQSQSGKIRYTVKYFSSAPASVLARHPFHTFSQDEPPLELQRAHQEDGANPIVEIITEVDALNSDGIGTSLRDAANIRATHMIIHSETLSQMIRDVVKFYPGQNLTGTSLVIHEPYACLMHHMSDLEHLIAFDRDPTELEHVQALLEFLRPRYQQQYVPAEERSSAAQPTVRFDDLWATMKPGSLAYTDWDGHRIGCVIGKSIRLPPKPSYDLPERWSVDFWFLQVHWPSDQIGCVSHTAVIDQFDGEKPTTSLPIYPAEFLDVTDQGKTKRRFTDRSRKVCEILWGESMYMEYDGECMDHDKQSYTGRIIVGGSYGIEELYPKHNWKFGWVPPNEVMKKDADVPLSEIELMVNPKRDHREILTVDHLFILSPCLSAFRLSNNDWVPITVENIRHLPEHHNFPSPIISTRNLEVITALVGSQDCEDGRRPLLSKKQGNGVIILLHGPPGVGKSYTLEYVSLTSGRPLLTLGTNDLGTSHDKLQTTLLRWFSLAFTRALGLFEGTLFLTVSRIDTIDEGVHSRLSLSVFLPPLSIPARGRIWSNLERRLNSEGTLLHRSATRFLHSPEARAVDFNGHEINHCFKVAIALATAQAKRSEGNVVIVKDSHFKEAMNVEHEFRQYMRSLSGYSIDKLTKRDKLRNDSFLQEREYPSLSDSDSSISAPEDEEAEDIPISIPREQVKSLLETSQRSVTLNSDSDLCIPDLNRAGWDAFRAAGAKELFRKTKFYAIDVLEGEPLIKLHIDNQKRRKRQNLTQKGARQAHLSLARQRYLRESE